MKLTRFNNNPIISPTGDDGEACATFNPADFYKDGKIHVLYRACGDYLKYKANLGYATFDKNMNLIERADEPIFKIDKKVWEFTIEDARICEIEEEYERAGDVPNVVFPEGNFVIDGDLVVIYGAADKYCCAAKINLSELIDHLLNNRCKS